jgi:hypothetical protein
MSLTLIEEPPQPFANIANANAIAVKTQAFYEFKREDAPLNEGISVTTNKNIQIDNIDLISAPYNWEVGDRIFVDYELQTGGQAQELTTIVGITDFAPDTIIEVPNTALPGSKSTTPVAGYINNLSKAYRVEFTVTDKGTGEQLLPPLAYKPKQNGVLKLDMSNAYSFTIVSNRTRWLAITWEEITEDGVLSSGNVTSIQAIAAERQIQSSPEGTNLARWLWRTNKTDQSTVLTFLEKPKTWINWTTFYSWIEPEEYPQGVQYSQKQEAYDVNGGFIFGMVNNLQIHGAVPTIKNETLDAPNNSPTFENTRFVRCFLTSSVDATPYDAPIDFEVQPDCDNAIMIQWVNALGGYEQYLFEYNQDVEDIAQVGETIIPPIEENIKDVNNAIGRIAEKTTQLITCYADHLTLNEIRTLHYLKKSEEVWVFTNKKPTDLETLDPHRIKVVIEDIYATQYSTRSNLHLFTVKIRFPDNYDFFEAKLY